MLSNPKGFKFNLQQSSRHIRSNACIKGRSSLSHKMLRPMSSMSMSPKERPNFPGKDRWKTKPGGVWWNIWLFVGPSFQTFEIRLGDEPVSLTPKDLFESQKDLSQVYSKHIFMASDFTKFPAKVFNSMVSVAEHAVKKRWKIRRSGYNTTGVTANNMAVPASTLTMTWGF